MLKRISMTCAGLAVAATAAFSGSHAGPHDGAIGARKAQMQLYGFHIGILGAMAQGKADYDADAAQAAADNLAALASMSQAAYWPAGSDMSSVEGTRAKAAIWEDFAGVGAEAAKLVEASAAMAAVAGESLEALQGAMGALGGSCGSCHKAYRGPKN